MTKQASENTAHVTPKVAILIISAIIVAVLGYAALGFTAGLETLFVGFLFAFAWGTFFSMHSDQLGRTVLGAIGGIALAYLCFWAPQQFGATAVILPLALITLAVFCLLVGWVPLLVNNSMMLFLSVFSIPGLVERTPIGDVAGSLLLATTYFGGLIVGGKFLASRRQSTSKALHG